MGIPASQQNRRADVRFGSMPFKKSPAMRALVSDLVFTGFVGRFASSVSVSWVIRPVRRRLHERCEPFQVLNNRSQVELIACAGEAPQSHALEAMMGL